MQSTISVTILTKNSEQTLAQTLDALVLFSEVLILDTGSTDSTFDLARKYANVSIHKSAFIGFGPLHNLATSLAKNDWILSIDSDEVLTPKLVKEISGLQLDIGSVYSISRANYFNGKRIRFCAGWYPDRVIRLYNRKATTFSDDAVHEKVLSHNLKKVSLKAPLLHTPYRCIGDFLSKMQTYSTLFAQQNQGKRKSGLAKALLHAWSAFFRSYFLKQGFLDGKEGLIISMYSGHAAFYKYLKLSEHQ